MKELISFVSHPYEKYTVDLYLYACELSGGRRPEARHVEDFRWVESADFEKYEFTPADEESMTELLEVDPELARSSP